MNGSGLPHFPATGSTSERTCNLLFIPLALTSATGMIRATSRRVTLLKEGPIAVGGKNWHHPRKVGLLLEIEGGLEPLFDLDENVVRQHSQPLGQLSTIERGHLMTQGDSGLSDPARASA